MIFGQTMDFVCLPLLILILTFVKFSQLKTRQLLTKKSCLINIPPQFESLLDIFEKPSKKTHKSSSALQPQANIAQFSFKKIFRKFCRCQITQIFELYRTEKPTEGISNETFLKTQSH